MGFYSRCIFPYVLELALKRPGMDRIRSNLLGGAAGHVLEIGFGTGRNLAHYPDAVTRVVGLEPNPGMRKWMMKRIAASDLPVDSVNERAESLPFDSGTFDTVVSTFTLCSVTDVTDVAREACRVLKPGGRFLFAEHGLSPDEKVRKWQHRLTPINRVFGDGCHLNRDIEALVAASGMRMEQVERYYMDQVPRVGGYMYQGSAVKER